MASNTSYAIKTDLKSYFEKWDSLGWSYFPLPYKSKVPDIKWEQYQTRKPTEVEKQSWLADETPHNWALVLGSISSSNPDGCLVALDFDELTNYEKWLPIAEDKLAISRLSDATLIQETSRGRHVLFDVAEPVKTQIFPNVEIRSQGAYILIEPSVHPKGKEYKWLSPEGTRPFTILSLTDVGLDVSQHKPDTATKENWITEAMQGVGEGQRDAICTKLCGHYLKSQPPDIVKSILYGYADRCSPPLAHATVDKVVDSIGKKELTNIANGVRSYVYEVDSPPHADTDTNREKSVSDSVRSEQTQSLVERIKNWLKDSTGWCSYDDIDKDLNLSPAERVNRRQVIKQFKEDSIVEKNPKNDKLIRYISSNVRKIDFKTATKRTPLDIKFPFGIEQYFNMYSGNIAVVAGSPDAGKTGWILNFIRLNQDKHAIFYQCSEMDKEELASRLMNFEGIELEDWNFEAEKRSGNFADVIRPDCINIIDYMELTEDVYMVADYLKAIHEKLESGIAIVALQKKIGAHLGRGAEFSLEKPRLYLSMDAGQTRIVKAKNWVRPDFNPNGMIIKYKIVGGCKFLISEDWHKPLGDIAI